LCRTVWHLGSGIGRNADSGLPVFEIANPLVPRRKA
jgi:hypothetical protein